MPFFLRLGLTVLLSPPAYLQMWTSAARGTGGVTTSATTPWAATAAPVTRATCWWDVTCATVSHKPSRAIVYEPAVEGTQRTPLSPSVPQVHRHFSACCCFKNVHISLFFHCCVLVKVHSGKEGLIRLQSGFVQTIDTSLNELFKLAFASANLDPFLPSDPELKMSGPLLSLFPQHAAKDMTYFLFPGETNNHTVALPEGPISSVLLQHLCSHFAALAGPSWDSGSLIRAADSRSS